MISGTDANGRIAVCKRILVRKFAFQLSRSPGFSHSDYSDLMQSLVHKADQALERYDPQRGNPWGFLSKVLENHVRNIVRFTRAQCRHPFRVRSINKPILTKEGQTVELSAILNASDCRRHRKVRPRDPQALINLIFDVRDVIQKCPPRVRALAEALMQDNISQVARNWGVPRTTLNHLKRRLAIRFEAAGLGRRKQRSRRRAPEASTPEPENLGRPLRRFRKADFE